MASTNPFQHASDEASGFGRSAERGSGLRGASRRTNKRRKKTGLAPQLKAASEGSALGGWPTFAELRPVLLFLCFPAAVVLTSVLMGGLPRPILYFSGLLIGIFVLASTFKTVEITIACILIYLPFAKVFVIPVLPGLNGTNMLIMLGFLTAFLRASREKDKFVDWPPGSSLVIFFGAYTALSAFTLLQHAGGGSVLKSEFLSYKSWLDQFVVYLLLAALIRDKAGAKRAMVYTMIGSMLVIFYSIPELLEKMGRSSIEKSRMVGPQLQSNNFGGFIAYTLLPMLAFFMVYIKDLRAWIITPYFIIAFKVLLTTFSRGAYLAIAAGGLLAGYYRGKVFLGMIGVLGVCAVLLFPSIIPQSLVDRMGGLIGGEQEISVPKEEAIDKSSSTRIDMWKAAGKMMAESPVLGKGFKGFAFLKSRYLEVDHTESDPHSMYMYIGSQMGLPALFLFILLMYSMFKMGRFLSQHKDDDFIRAVGIGCAAAAVCYGIINVFGSRAVALNFTVYFWTYMLILQVLKRSVEEESEGYAGGTKSGRRGGAGRGSAKMATAGIASEAMLDDATVIQQQLEAKRRKNNRSVARLPKRGAAAHLAREAERAQIEAELAARKTAQFSDSRALSTNLGSDESTVYETRGVRKAKAAAAAKAERLSRRKRPNKPN
ncbi:MAG: O-antigen ligase family protein [Granulosicoccus sp.]